MGISHFFAYISRMKNIKRWGLMRNTQEENALEHSMLCAYIAHALAHIRNTYYGGQVDAARVMEIAAFHEVGEVITGDVATPIKYFNDDISTAFRSIESAARTRLQNMLPAELRPCYADIIDAEESDEWPIVKAADRICAYLKCEEELRAGNSEFEKARDNILADIQKIDRPEVEHFMREFAPSFSLTLDELN